MFGRKTALAWIFVVLGACSNDSYIETDADVVAPDQGMSPDGQQPDQSVSQEDSTLVSDTGDTADGKTAADHSVPAQTTFGGNRPTELLVPSDYDPSRAYPLVITLHGYGSDGQTHLQYLGLGSLVDSAKVLVTAPNGSSYLGTLGWNSIPELSSPDDEGYLVSLINEIGGVYNVDPTRTFIVGHSAGGFMAYRMACEHPDLVRGIVALATSTFYEDKGDCTPSQPVSVLHIHGTADDQVDYDGGYVVPLNYTTEYPPVTETVAYWADYNGCGATLQSNGTIDLDLQLPGAETTVEQFDCPTGTGVELWTIEGGEHVPNINPLDFAQRTMQWLLDHAT